MSAERRAAQALAAVYKGMPGVVAALVGGNSVEEVQASYEAAQKAYADVKNDVLREQGVVVPPGHGGGVVQPVPADPFEMIRVGVSVSRK